MQTRSTNAIPLASRPNLEHYRKLSKDFLKAVRTNDTSTVHAWAVEWLERLNRLNERTESVDREAHAVVEDARRAGFLDRDGTRGAVSLADAHLFMARLHGFGSWPRFSAHVSAHQQPSSHVSLFESAADAIVAGDVAGLTSLLRKSPDLVRSRSSREHGATLLHYVAANGHEGFRQRTPKNAVAIATELLQAGAAADALASMYNHPCTTLQMLVSSDHPHAAGVQVDLIHTLIDFGAAVDGVEQNGSPLMTAFRFHYPAAADALVRRGARIDNVIAAAALGRSDLIEQFVTDDGTLQPGVRLAFGPWPGLPPDPAVHLAYALTWAATFGRRDAVELLLRKGVDPDSHDDDAGALHFAAAHGRMDIVRLLLNHGASLEARNSYDGTVLDGLVWYALNAPIESVDYAAVARELIAAGAREDVYPEMKAYVDLVLAGRRGGGYPDAGEGG
jgi:ankyrin repeat protein